MVFQIGGFKCDDQNLSDGNVQYTVTNYMEQNSFFYHAPVVPPYIPRGSVPWGMGTMKQTYQWTGPNPPAR